MKLTTKKATKKSVKHILEAMEDSRAQGIRELVDGATKGSYHYQTATGEWRSVSTTNLVNSMMQNKIDADTVTSVHMDTVRTQKQLVLQASERNAKAAADKRFSNALKGHAGIKRTVKVYDTIEKASVTVESAYAAARVIGCDRSTVYSRLRFGTGGAKPAGGRGRPRQLINGRYRVSYTY
jgi:hypothetical protein